MNKELYMARALELARLGFGNTNPNPMVACVLVHNDRIIGEGYHQIYGGAHAEVNAVNSVVNKELLKESTAFVSLEPCSHFGKTPPCADLLIKNKIKKVVVCNLDPNPLVSGSGINKLKAAGIEVELGVLEKEGLKLNKRFFTAQVKKRPYIILKWAETLDGFIADENSQSIKISNEYSDFLNHTWRTQEDAILVGTNTAVNDNPKLNSRKAPGKDPIRIFIDKKLKIPNSHFAFDKTQKTIIVNCLEEKNVDDIHFLKIEDDPNFLNNMLKALAKLNIISVLVEGGAKLHTSFIEAKLFDEIRIIKSSSSQHIGLPSVTVPQNIPLVSETPLGNDTVKIFQKD